VLVLTMTIPASMTGWGYRQTPTTKIAYNSMWPGSVGSGAGTVGFGVVQYGSGAVRCGK